MFAVRDWKPIAQRTPDTDDIALSPLAHQAGHFTDLHKSKFNAGRLTLRIIENIEQRKRPTQQRVAAGGRSNHEELAGRNCRGQFRSGNSHGPGILSHLAHALDRCRMLLRTENHPWQSTRSIVTHITALLSFERVQFAHDFSLPPSPE